MADLYTGIENVLKRISDFHGVRVPAGDTWHLDLFRQFCRPASPPLPALLDGPLAALLTPYRKFRHVFHHGYSFRLDWARMSDGVANARAAFDQFREAVSKYAAELESSAGSESNEG